MSIPNEILIQIFNNYFKDIDNHRDDRIIIKTLKNIRLSSKKLNNIISIIINDFYYSNFKSNIKEYSSNIWFNIIINCIKFSFESNHNVEYMLFRLVPRIIYLFRRTGISIIFSNLLYELINSSQGIDNVKKNINHIIDNEIINTYDFYLPDIDSKNHKYFYYYCDNIRSRYKWINNS